MKIKKKCFFGPVEFFEKWTFFFKSERAGYFRGGFKFPAMDRKFKTKQIEVKNDIGYSIEQMQGISVPLKRSSVLSRIYCTHITRNKRHFF